MSTTNVRCDLNHVVVTTDPIGVELASHLNVKTGVHDSGGGICTFKNCLNDNQKVSQITTISSCDMNFIVV
jgi:hypothetical protein